MRYMKTCNICGSTNLYTAIPSGILYCRNCGNKAEAKRAVNLPPGPEQDDVRRNAEQTQAVASRARAKASG